MHALGNIVLVYFVIGSLLWVVLDFLGITGRAYRGRLGAGPPPTFVDMALAILWAIIVWPVVMRKLLMHPQWTIRTLARNLWGRS